MLLLILLGVLFSLGCFSYSLSYPPHTPPSKFKGHKSSSPPHDDSLLDSYAHNAVMLESSYDFSNHDTSQPSIPMFYKHLGECSGTVGGESFHGKCVDLHFCVGGTVIEGFCKQGGEDVQCCISEPDGVRVLPKGPAEWASKFKIWQKTYRINDLTKRYENEKRLEIFKKNVKFIHYRNKERRSFKLAINERADRELSEVFPLSAKGPTGAAASSNPPSKRSHQSNINGAFTGPKCNVEQFNTTGVCVSEQLCKMWEGNSFDECGDNGGICCLSNKKFIDAMAEKKRLSALACVHIGTVHLDWRNPTNSSHVVVTPVKNQG